VIIPEIADYEVRRELLRLRASAALRRLDLLGGRLEYVPLTTAAIRRAAELWAQMRQQGQPTADPQALDADVILAAQAQLAAGPDDLLTVATTNVGHLGRLVPAQLWQEIT
jgi:predicted nucleic acid-binding protein